MNCTRSPPIPWKVMFLMLSIGLSCVVRFIPLLVSFFSVSVEVSNVWSIVLDRLIWVYRSIHVNNAAISINGLTMIGVLFWSLSPVYWAMFVILVLVCVACVWMVDITLSILSHSDL